MEKDLYIKKMESKLEQLELKIAGLKAKAKESTIDTRMAIEKQIDALHRKKENFKGMLGDLKAKSEGKWEETKENIEKSWEDLRQSLDHALTP